MKQRLILLMTALLLICPKAGAQTSISVKGNVKDAETGETLVGVTVAVSGSNTGSITDIDGNFSLSNVISNASLIVSYLGYETQTVALNGRTAVDIALKPSAELLEEVVVVGYTTQKRRDVLGAVGKLQGENLTKLPVATAEQALQGRIAGVQVSNVTGAPGAGTSVRVRGTSSINASNEPLYIIDGIPVEGGLNTISPNDIDNISVLKDASSAAIYGSRANNGIVLITTKSGKKGSAKVSYNGQYGYQVHGRLTPMVNTQNYISIYNEAATIDNLSSAAVKRPLIEGDYLQDFANTDHLEEIFQTAPIQSHELSVSGGNDKTTYLVSGSYFNQNGIIINSGYNKANIRTNINSDVKSWLTVGMNVTAGLANTTSVPSSGDGYQNSEGGSVVRYAFFRNPAIPVYDNNGNYVDKPSEYYGNSAYDSFFGDGYNPVGWANLTDRKRQDKTFIGSGNFLIRFPKNFSLKTVFGADYKNGEYRQFNQTWGTNNRINNPNSLAVDSYSQLGWTINSVLNYNTVINEVHTISAMAGTEAIHNSLHTISNSDQDFADSNIYLGYGLGKKTQSENYQNYSLASFFGSVNYNYMQKYYLSGTIRRDGSSRFSEGNKWGTFYSASAGWNIESESFMKDIQAIEKLKLRAGWGAVGNQNIRLYAYSDQYGKNFNYPFGGIAEEGYAQTMLGNQNLKWETSQQFNIGVDMAFLENSLGFSVDYFNKISKDMLVLASLPPSIGYAQPFWINNGEVLNQGIDLEIFYRKNYKDAGFNITFNGGYLKNEVLKTDAPIIAGRVDQGLFATRTEAGYPIGSFYMLEMAGIFQNQTEVFTSAFQGNGIQPGDVKYVDQNKDGKIDANDRVHVGSPIPTFTTGLNLSGYWKNFDVSCFFQGAFGQDIYAQIQQDIEGFYRGFPVTQRYFDEHWTGEGTSNTQPRASWNAKSNNVKVSTRFLEDGSYLRLKNLQIGYTIPKTEKIGIERLRVFTSGTNLLTFTRYSGMDPEMTVSANSFSEGDKALGIDWGTYPVAKSFTFGVNLTF